MDKQEPPHKPDEFYTRGGRPYDRKRARGISWTSVDVLDFLKGKPWDEIALAYVHGLRPSDIRVTRGECTLDGRTWRVTVFVDKNNIITGIHQEVEVAIPDRVQHADHLRTALRYGINSPQALWHEDDSIEGYMYAPDGYYKQCSEGMVPYPKDENADVLNRMKDRFLLGKRKIPNSLLLEEIRKSKEQHERT